MNACSAAGEWNVGNLLKASYKKVLTFHYQFQMAELEMLHFVEYNIYLTGWDNKLVRLTSSITGPPPHVCVSSRAVITISSCWIYRITSNDSRPSNNRPPFNGNV